MSLVFGSSAAAVGRYVRFVCVGMMAISAAPLFLSGQTTPEQADHRKYCEMELATLNARGSDPVYRRAISNIQSCSSFEVGRALAAQWRQPQPDTIASRMLGHVSGLIRDQSLFEAVAEVAAQGNRSRHERLSALSALVSYYDPRVRIAFSSRLDESNLHASSYVSMGRINDVVTRTGVNPLATETRNRVLRLLATLGSSDSDPVVRSIAAYLPAQLSQIK